MDKPIGIWKVDCKDVKMNSTGVKQMLEIAEHLQKMNFHVDQIISSPLDRAKESAKIIAGTNNIYYLCKGHHRVHYFHVFQ